MRKRGEKVPIVIVASLILKVCQNTKLNFLGLHYHIGSQIFDTKPYDKIYFDALKEDYGIEIEYFESKLSPRSAVMAKNVSAVVAFVNDDVCKETIDVLKENGVELITAEHMQIINDKRAKEKNKK